MQPGQPYDSSNKIDEILNDVVTSTGTKPTKHTHNMKRNQCTYFLGKYYITGLILGLRPANERRRYFVTTSLIGWVQV